MMSLSQLLFDALDRKVHLFSYHELSAVLSFFESVLERISEEEDEQYFYNTVIIGYKFIIACIKDRLKVLKSEEKEFNLGVVG